MKIPLYPPFSKGDAFVPPFGKGGLGGFTGEEAVNREHEARMNVMHGRFKGRLS